MRVTGNQTNSGSAPSQMRPALCEAAASDAANSDQPASASRALVPLSPVRFTGRAKTVTRQPANFLTHLIATQQAIPQTRERRRVEPNIAAAIYSAAGNTFAPASREVTRAL